MTLILILALCISLLIDDHIRSAHDGSNIVGLSQISECISDKDHIFEHEDEMLLSAQKVKDNSHFHMPDYICYCEAKRVEIQNKLTKSL